MPIVQAASRQQKSLRAGLPEYFTISLNIGAASARSPVAIGDIRSPSLIEFVNNWPCHFAQCSLSHSRIRARRTSEQTV